MLNFCTLFDSNYLVKGLCMHSSLCKTCSDFHLFIFAFDEKAYTILNKLELGHVTLISLSEFEDDELLNAKKNRSRGEYCWTCSSSTILYCIQHFQLSNCTYLDSDLYFYSNPSILIDEMGTKDVLITSHRYTPEFDQSISSGKYCVQFITFKNTENGLKVLNWWRDACLDWCYDRIEDGKFGDQKYLDDWPTRFDGIHELVHPGGGLAPWNMQQYSFSEQNTKLTGTELASGLVFEVVFFHFHGLLLFKKGIFREFYFTWYPLSDNIRKYIYLPYISQIKNQRAIIKKLDNEIEGLAIKKSNISWWEYGKSIVRRTFTKDNNYTFWLK